MTQAHPIVPEYQDYYQFRSWSLTYPLEDLPDTEEARFGQFLCSILRVITKDAIISHEIRKRLVSHITELSFGLSEDDFLLTRIHDEIQKSRIAIHTTVDDIRSHPNNPNIRQEINNHRMAVRNSPLAQYLDKFLVPREVDFSAAENIFDDYANNDKAILSIVKNEAKPEWLAVLSLESMLVRTLFQKNDFPDETHNQALEWSVSKDVLQACCVYVLHNQNDYENWGKHKLALLHNKKYLMSFTEKELYSFPLFYINDLFNKGDILPVLFEIIGDSTIHTQIRNNIKDSVMLACSRNRTEMLILQKYADKYGQLTGTVLSFSPWRYPDIKEEFLAYYKDVFRGAIENDKSVILFVDSCLPVIVEKVLPSIENANQAVGIILLVRNAKSFGAKWKAVPFETFKMAMEKILHLEAFHKKLGGVREKNDATRLAASRIREKFPSLKHFTSAPEG